MSPTGPQAPIARPVVRPAQRRDAAELGRFITRAWRESGPGALGFTGATDEAIKEISSVEFLTSRLSSPNTRIIVAEEKGEVVGFASIQIISSDSVELSGVVVLKSEEGKGLGTRLVSKATQSAAGLGRTTLFVKTEVFNPGAIGFYQKCGFVEKRRVTEKVGRTRVSLVVLEKKLGRQIKGKK